MYIIFSYAAIRVPILQHLNKIEKKHIPSMDSLPCSTWKTSCDMTLKICKENKYLQVSSGDHIYLEFQIWDRSLKSLFEIWYSSYFFLKIRFIYMKGTETEINIPSTGLLPKWLQPQRLGQAKARRPGLHLAFLYGCRGLNCLSHLRLLPSCICRELD